MPDAYLHKTAEGTSFCMKLEKARFVTALVRDIDPFQDILGDECPRSRYFARIHNALSNSELPCCARTLIEHSASLHYR